MKSLFRPFLMIAVAASLFTASSCTKTCDAGYEGSDCKTEVRTKILGTYGVPENCSSTGNANYDVAITGSGTDVQKVLISTFGGYSGVSAVATIDETTLTIASQTVAGYTFSGTGTVNNNGASITVNYTISDGTDSETCTGTWTKK